jgi:hypothetical protein
VVFLQSRTSRVKISNPMPALPFQRALAFESNFTSTRRFHCRQADSPALT